MTGTDDGDLREDIRDLRLDIRDLRTEIRNSSDNHVSHREWAQRNVHVDTRLQGLGREIGDLRTEVRAKSAPWWSVGSLIVSGLVLVWNVIRP